MKWVNYLELRVSQPTNVLLVSGLMSSRPQRKETTFEKAFAGQVFIAVDIGWQSPHQLIREESTLRQGYVTRKESLLSF